MKNNSVKRRRLFWMANFALFWLLKINIFRKKNIWVFDAWEGNQFDDNSKYLFEYVNKNHETINAIWLSNNASIVNMVRSQGYKAEKSNSWNGIKTQLKAGVYFYTNGIDDISNVPLIYGALIIGLWHGTGMKNVYYEMNNMKKKSIRNMLKSLKDKLFKSSYQDYAIATSEKVAEMRSNTYRLPLSKILITGQPRNDVFKQKTKKRKCFINTS